MYVANAIKRNPEYIVLGTSKSLNGMPLSQNKFNEYRYLNCSIPGTNFYELSIIIDYILTHGENVEQVVLTLDFLTFSSRRTIQGDFNISKFSSEYNLWSDFCQLLSWKCLYDSYLTFKKNREGFYTSNLQGDRFRFFEFFQVNFLLTPNHILIMIYPEIS